MIYVNGSPVYMSNFPDGTLLTQAPIKKDEVLCSVLGKVSFRWEYENDAELFALICLRRHYGTYNATLKMLYCPHARMDRVKNDTDVFTLKYFCEVINSLDFSRVEILDPHSNVAPALLNNVEILSPYHYIEKAIKKHSENGERDFALYFPDAGAMKRYTEFNFFYPYAYGNKKRDWNTGVILDAEIIGVENIIGKDVLIIDDICCKGTTFYYSAKKLLELGAKSVSLYVTHCENAIKDGQIFDSDLIQNIYTTNSIKHCEEVKNKVIYVS